MLDRILEPEVMDTVTDADAYDRMDHSAVNQCFVADLLDRLRLSGKSPLSVLDLGAGTALIPIVLCQQLPNCHVTAVEAAASMIEIARRHLAENHFTDRITLVHADAKRLSDDLGQFDVVMSNSLVHHLADLSPMLRNAAAHTASEGLLFVRDLLRPRDTKTLNYLVDTYAGDATPEQRKLFADSLRAALTLEEIRDTVAELGFPRETVEQTSDRHWTWSATQNSSGVSGEW